MSIFPYARDCDVCGTPFLIMDGGQARRKFCSPECRRKRQLSNKSRYKREKKGYQSYMRNAVEAAEKSRSLVDFTVEARKNGMTYGQWQAQQYINQSTWKKHEVKS